MALIEFHLDPQPGVSLYAQIVQQVREALLVGLLKPGDRLPTVKDVVAQVAINPNTVLRAYRDLERDGVVVIRPGLGTFIAQDVRLPQAHPRALRGELERWIAKARALGLDEDTIAALFAHALRESAKDAVA